MNESTIEDVRRQSILKQRIRLPLQEAPQLFTDDDTTTTLTHNRRVSFGRNLVKEFIVGSAASTQALHEYEQSSESVSEPSTDCSGPLDLVLNKSCIEDIDEVFGDENVPPVITPPDAFNDSKRAAPEQRVRPLTECIGLAMSMLEDRDTVIIIGSKSSSKDDERRHSFTFSSSDMNQWHQGGESRLRLSPRAKTAGDQHHVDFIPVRHPEIFNSNYSSSFDKSQFEFLDGTLSMPSAGSSRNNDPRLPLQLRPDHMPHFKFKQTVESDMEETCVNPVGRTARTINAAPLYLIPRPYEEAFDELSMEPTCQHPLSPDMSMGEEMTENNVLTFNGAGLSMDDDVSETNVLAFDAAGDDFLSELASQTPNKCPTKNISNKCSASSGNLVDSFESDASDDTFGPRNSVSNLRKELACVSEGNRSFMEQCLELSKTSQNTSYSADMSRTIMRTHGRVITTNEPSHGKNTPNEETLFPQDSVDMDCTGQNISLLSNMTRSHKISSADGEAILSLLPSQSESFLVENLIPLHDSVDMDCTSESMPLFSKKSSQVEVATTVSLSLGRLVENVPTENGTTEGYEDMDCTARNISLPFNTMKRSLVTTPVKIKSIPPQSESVPAINETPQGSEDMDCTAQNASIHLNAMHRTLMTTPVKITTIPPQSESVPTVNETSSQGSEDMDCTAQNAMHRTLMTTPVKITTIPSLTESVPTENKTLSQGSEDMDCTAQNASFHLNAMHQTLMTTPVKITTIPPSSESVPTENDTLSQGSEKMDCTFRNFSLPSNAMHRSMAPTPVLVAATVPQMESNSSKKATLPQCSDLMESTARNTLFNSDMSRSLMTTPIQPACKLPEGTRRSHDNPDNNKNVTGNVFHASDASRTLISTPVIVNIPPQDSQSQNNFPEKMSHDSDEMDITSGNGFFDLRKSMSRDVNNQSLTPLENNGVNDSALLSAPFEDIEAQLDISTNNVSCKVEDPLSLANISQDSNDEKVVCLLEARETSFERYLASTLSVDVLHNTESANEKIPGLPSESVLKPSVKTDIDSDNEGKIEKSRSVGSRQQVVLDADAEIISGNVSVAISDLVGHKEALVKAPTQMNSALETTEMDPVVVASSDGNMNARLLADKSSSHEIMECFSMVASEKYPTLSRMSDPNVTGVKNGKSEIEGAFVLNSTRLRPESETLRLSEASVERSFALHAQIGEIVESEVNLPVNEANGNKLQSQSSLNSTDYGNEQERSDIPEARANMKKPDLTVSRIIPCSEPISAAIMCDPIDKNISSAQVEIMVQKCKGLELEQKISSSADTVVVSEPEIDSDDLMPPIDKSLVSESFTKNSIGPNNAEAPNLKRTCVVPTQEDEICLSALENAKDSSEGLTAVTSEKNHKSTNESSHAESLSKVFMDVSNSLADRFESNYGGITAENVAREISNWPVQNSEKRTINLSYESAGKRMHSNSPVPEKQERKKTRMSFSPRSGKNENNSKNLSSPMAGDFRGNLLSIAMKNSSNVGKALNLSCEGNVAGNPKDNMPPKEMSHDSSSQFLHSLTIHPGNSEDQKVQRVNESPVPAKLKEVFPEDHQTLNTMANDGPQELQEAIENVNQVNFDENSTNQGMMDSMTVHTFPRVGAASTPFRCTVTDDDPETIQSGICQKTYQCGDQGENLDDKTYRVSITCGKEMGKGEETYTLKIQSQGKRTHSDSPVSGKQVEKKNRFSGTPKLMISRQNAIFIDEQAESSMSVPEQEAWEKPLSDTFAKGSGNDLDVSITLNDISLADNDMHAGDRCDSVEWQPYQLSIAPRRTFVEENSVTLGKSMAIIMENPPSPIEVPCCELPCSGSIHDLSNALANVSVNEPVLSLNVPASPERTEPVPQYTRHINSSPPLPVLASQGSNSSVLMESQSSQTSEQSGYRSRPTLPKNTLDETPVDRKVHQQLLMWSKEPSCLWRLEHAQLCTVNAVEGEFQMRFPLLEDAFLLSIKFSREGDHCLITSTNAAQVVPKNFQYSKQKITTAFGFEAFKNFVQSEEHKMRLNFEELPYCMIYLNSFCKKLSSVLEQTLTVLKGYGGSQLINNGLRFRIISYSLDFICTIEINLADVLSLGRPALIYDQYMGFLNEGAINEVLVNSWKGDAPILSFIRAVVAYVVTEEEKVKFVTKRPPLLF